MYFSTKAVGLILAMNFLFCSNFYLVLGEKPFCKGESLKNSEFSKEDEVGFVRDLIVDVLARNIFNLFDLPSTRVCEKLAKYKTSTCFIICHKWKRSKRKSEAEKVMTMAEDVVADMYSNVLKNIKNKSIDQEKNIAGLIDEVKDRLVKSKAANSDSPIIALLDIMKTNYCENNLRNENEKNQAKKNQIKKLWENDDVVSTLRLFEDTYETKNKVQISKPQLDIDVVKEGDNMESNTIRFKFEQPSTDGKGSMKKSVILKIPSLYASPDVKLKTTNIFNQEANFYTKILPELNRRVPELFAPILQLATPTGALVLEDLIAEGFILGDRTKIYTIQEAKTILTVLAQFHAAGHTYLEKNLGKDDQNIPANQPGPVALAATTKKNLFDKFCELIKPQLGERLYQKVMKLENEILADPVIVTNPERTIITVITHGDLQAKNILLKYDNKGNIMGAKLSNWQSSRKGNPVIDLIYFFVTGLRIQDFQWYDQQLVEHYRAELKKNLRSLRIPDTYDFLTDLKAHKYYYLQVISIYWQQILSHGRSGKELDEYMHKYVLNAERWILYLENGHFVKDLDMLSR